MKSTTRAEKEAKLMRLGLHDVPEHLSAHSAGGRRSWMFPLMMVVVTINALVTIWLVVQSQRFSRNSVSHIFDADASGVFDNAGSDNSGVGKSVLPAQPIVLEASGYVAAERIATVSSRLSGMVADVLVEEGQSVSKGMVVAHLDPTQAEHDLAAARARLLVARAQERQASVEENEQALNLVREQELVANGYSSQTSVLRASTARESAQARAQAASATVHAAQVEVKRLEWVLSEHIIRAPFDGVVISRNAQPGEVLFPGAAGGGFARTGICTIVDMASLEIIVDVSEQLIDRVRPGQAVRAELYAHPEWQFPARVNRIMPNADRGRGTIRVRIALDADDERILPDMAVKVAFI